MASCLHAHATKPTTNVNGCFPSVSLILLIHVLLGLLFCWPKCWPPHRMQTHPRAAVLRHDSIGVCSVRAAKAKNLANRLTAYQRGYLVFLIILATHQLSMLINGTAARLTTSYKRMDGLPHRFASFSEKVFFFFYVSWKEERWRFRLRQIHTRRLVFSFVEIGMVIYQQSMIE